MEKEKFFNRIFSLLREDRNYHSVNNHALYHFIKYCARHEVNRIYEENNIGQFDFPEIGTIYLPYYKMGNVSSANLFDLDELIIFCFYLINRERYKRVADIGANLGLHSIILAKLGFTVRAYEPEDAHFTQLQNNFEINKVNIHSYKKAISDRNGVASFVKVMGNTTGSHIVGSKPDPYGELEIKEVPLLAFNEIADDIDLIKLDVEGHEKQILLSTTENRWRNLDAVCEISSIDNAKNIYEHFSSMAGVNLFSQKTGWSRVCRLEDVPTSYKEGSVFITSKQSMPWE